MTHPTCGVRRNKWPWRNYTLLAIGFFLIGMALPIQILNTITATMLAVPVFYGFLLWVTRQDWT